MTNALATARWIRPITLEGRIVRLEPLGRQHFDDLVEVGMDPVLWKWTQVLPETEAQLRAYLELALANAEAGTEVPFATILRETGRAIGSTRFLTIVPEHKRLEIGWTWLGRDHQRSGANREAKLLQLTHCFEVLGANRVEFKTDSRNEASRRALEGIGATFEGIFRSHTIMPWGPLRDSAYYSVIAGEWPQVKAHLEGLLAR
ncbi:MAG: GNAT family N-acetyltransferase [Chloroflexi bacterium]|nr:GNAT family N-acetyltransferase [Chloroflexota bacterium]